MAKNTEYQHAIYVTGITAMKMVIESIPEKIKSGEEIKSTNEFFDLWIDTNEKTYLPKLHKARKFVLEMLLIHHPLDYPVCDIAGECQLQDLAYQYGSAQSRFEAERNHEPESIAAPLVERNPNRCILCGKCVRVCYDHQGVGAINLLGRGFKSKVSPAFEETLA